MTITTVLDQIFSIICPIAMVIFVGALVAFTITEIGIFFYDRKEKKKKGDADQ